MATHRMHPETAVLTRGFDPRLSVGSARPPVYRTSTYVFSSPEAAERAFAVALGKVEPGEMEAGDLIYARLSHPNAEIVEDQLVPLEPSAQAAAIFNSGMAAISAVLLRFLQPGDTIVYTLPLYGGTHHLIQQLIVPLGIRACPVAAGDTQELRRAIAQSEKLRIVFIETPANPTLVMTDIGAASEAIKKRPQPALLAVDNTLLGPTFQHPLAHGADLVIYSATKFLGGFSDLLAGVVMAVDPELVIHLRRLRAILGNILQADECWILDSRLSTVSLRMNRQSKNAQRIATRLAEHPAIKRVYYPSLFSDPEQCRIRDLQTDFPGSMMTLEFNGGKPAAFDFLRRLSIARNAVSLGGVESLACHPLTTTHSELSAEELEHAGVNDAMVRVSVGTEHWRDLLEDFVNALNF
jgi:methionine-gamma-lyase